MKIDKHQQEAFFGLVFDGARRAATLAGWEANQRGFDWYPCGGASPMVKGSTAFGKWLVRTGNGHECGSKGIAIDLQCGYGSSQAYNLHIAIASAVVQYLAARGIKAHVWSYID